MAINIRNINCPQCGSTDVTMISSTRIKCNSCGSQTLVKDVPEHQAVYNETHVHYDGKNNRESRRICSVKNAFSEEQFIRDAWIKLAKADVPMEVFKENFGPVEHVEHETILDTLTATVSYTAEIGNDRQEPYIDYETYYEKVVIRDSNGNERIESVPKQRQVTKYKTVTDWTPLSGSNTFQSSVVVENKPGVSLNESAFRKCMGEALSDGRNFGSIDEKKLKTLNNPNNANSRISRKHVNNLHESVLYSLPGDQQRNLCTNVTEEKNRTVMVAVSTEYKASLKYKDKDYTWSAFAFGIMNAFGDAIENKESLRKNVKEMRDGIIPQVWNKVKFLFVVTLCMLVISIFLSIIGQPCVPAVALVAAAAVSLFIIFCVHSSKVNKEITERVEGEIENFSEDYQKKLLNVLNEKLNSLGLEPAEASDLEKIR